MDDFPVSVYLDPPSLGFKYTQPKWQTALPKNNFVPLPENLRGVVAEGQGFFRFLTNDIPQGLGMTLSNAGQQWE